MLIETQMILIIRLLQCIIFFLFPLLVIEPYNYIEWMINGVCIVVELKLVAFPFLWWHMQKCTKVQWFLVAYIFIYVLNHALDGSSHGCVLPCCCIFMYNTLSWLVLSNSPQMCTLKIFVCSLFQVIYDVFKWCMYKLSYVL